MEGKTIEHKCSHEKDWEEMRTFKDRVIEFIGEKTATNGQLKLEDEKLEKRLSTIENRMWGFMVAILILSMGILFKP